MFAYLIPVFLGFILTFIIFKFNSYFKYNYHSRSVIPILTIAGFFVMFSIPFFFGKFMETSRYTPIYESYVRYTGLITIFVLTGSIYLILKENKSFEEWYLILCLMLLTAFIYQQTYLKYLLQVFLVPVACIALMNLIKLINKKRIASYILIISLISFIIFSGYYAFLHEYRSGRNIEDSTYIAGMWLRNYEKGIGISNDRFFGVRIFATSEKVHIFTPFSLINYIYDFHSIKDFDFKMYSITSEEFWYNFAQMKKDIGEEIWYYLNTMEIDTRKFNISFIVENVQVNRSIMWHHDKTPSKLLMFAYDKESVIYSNGKVNILTMD